MALKTQTQISSARMKEQTTRREYQHYLMSVYQKAVKAAKAGYIDRGRLNKALGILMSKNYQTCTGEEYYTTTTSCTCSDWVYRNKATRKTSDGHPYRGSCKHIIAKQIEVRMSEMIEEDMLSGLFGQTVKIG